MNDPYAGYAAWKKWDAPFAYSPEEARYFAGETRGMAIARAAVLEIGFGAGSFLAWARDRGAEIAGAEVNDFSLAAARERGVALLDPFIERAAEAYAARFDTIAAFDVFEHFTIEEVRIRIAAAARMLRPGGHLMLRFPNAQSPFGLAPQFGDPTHQSGLSRSAIEPLAQGAGLTVVRYGPPYLALAGNPLRAGVRLSRAMLRGVLGAVLNFVYGQAIPWDPVVVLVLRKSDAV